jgi:hypothetical protein
MMRQEREPLVPEPDTTAIRARALRIAVVLRATFSQDELRLLSWAVYRSATRGTLHPARMAVLRPILTALALAIDYRGEEDPARPRG